MKFFAVLILSCLCLPVLAQTNADLHLIYVNGLAERTVEPNMVMVRVESWAKASTANAAQAQQALQYAKVKAAAEKFKIKKEDIQTEGYSVNPEYTWEPKTQVNRITGYRVSHTVLLIYRKTDDAGTFLDAMIFSKGEASGINVQNITWDYDKKSVVESEALGDAVKNARSKANEMARAAGVEIRAVHKIQHNSYTPPVPRPMYAEAAMMKSMSDAAPATEVSSGLIKVRVEVQMEFEIQ